MQNAGVVSINLEWDETKRRQNLQKHGIDFLLAATTVFSTPHIDFASNTSNEPRRKVVGILAGRHFTIIYTFRVTKIRIISVRIARDNERRAYNKLFS